MSKSKNGDNSIKQLKTDEFKTGLEQCDPAKLPRKFTDPEMPSMATILAKAKPETGESATSRHRKTAQNSTDFRLEPYNSNWIPTRQAD